jgi:uncharacterized damage-inducible protein DinB
MEEPLVETWSIHNRINLYLLEAVPAEALGSTLAPKHRSIGQIFVHVHNVRLMWLKAAPPDLLEDIAKLEAAAADKAAIAAALEASGRAIEALLRKSVAAGGKIKGFKPHATAFAGYLISHESHHRSQVVWTLKNAGHPIDQKTSYGLWEWGVR